MANLFVLFSRILFFLLTFRFSAADDVHCTSRYGTGINIRHCEAALRLFDALAEHDVGQDDLTAPQWFSRNTLIGNPAHHLPKPFIVGTCSIGIDVSDPDHGTLPEDHVRRSSWAAIRQYIEQLMKFCVIHARASGGIAKFDGLEVVLITPAIERASGTCLRPPHPLGMSLSRCLDSQDPNAQGGAQSSGQAPNQAQREQLRESSVSPSTTRKRRHSETPAGSGPSHGQAAAQGQGPDIGLLQAPQPASNNQEGRQLAQQPPPASSPGQPPPMQQALPQQPVHPHQQGGPFAPTVPLWDPPPGLGGAGPQLHPPQNLGFAQQNFGFAQQDPGFAPQNHGFAPHFQPGVQPHGLGAPAPPPGSPPSQTRTGRAQRGPRRG